MKSLEARVDVLKLGLEFPHVHLSNHFDNLINQIDIAVETAIYKGKSRHIIEPQRMQMIDKLKMHLKSLVEVCQLDDDFLQRFELIGTFGQDVERVEDSISELERRIMGEKCFIFMESRFFEATEFGSLIFVSDAYIGVRGVEYLRRMFEESEEKIIHNYSMEHLSAFCLHDEIEKLELIKSNEYFNEIVLNKNLRKQLEFYRRGMPGQQDQAVWAKYRICSLNSDVFNGLYALENIDLSSQLIENVHPKLFTGLKRLKKISLCGNQIEKIDRNVFEDLSAIESINLGINNLREIDKTQFHPTPNISTICLSHNHLTQEIGDLFQGLTNLKAVMLSNNQFTELSGSIFHSLNALKIVDMNSNRIKSAGNVFMGSPNIEILDLSNNQLESLNPEIFSQFLNLKMLNLKRNLFKSIDKELLSANKSLEMIDLSENLLETLDPSLLKGMKMLKLLYLNGNQLTEIDGDFFNELDSLERVDLSRNPLANFDQNRLNGLSKSVEVLYV